MSDLGSRHPVCLTCRAPQRQRSRHIWTHLTLCKNLDRDLPLPATFSPCTYISAQFMTGVFSCSSLTSIRCIRQVPPLNRLSSRLLGPDRACKVSGACTDDDDTEHCHRGGGDTAWWSGEWDCNLHHLGTVRVTVKARRVRGGESGIPNPRRLWIASGKGNHVVQSHPSLLLCRLPT